MMMYFKISFLQLEYFWLLHLLKNKRVFGRSKYLRIHKVLSGRSLGESPKFKFWVKSKGFCFLPCPQRNGWPSEMSGMIIALPNKVSFLFLFIFKI